MRARGHRAEGHVPFALALCSLPCCPDCVLFLSLDPGAVSIAGRACNCGCTCACGITIGVAGGTIGSGGAGGGGLGTAAAGISVPSELVGCVGCGLTSTVTSVGTLPPLVATAEPSCD